MISIEIALGVVFGVLILAYLSQIVRWTALSVFLLLFLTVGIVLSVIIESVVVPEFIEVPVSSTLAYFSLGMSIFAFIGLLWETYKERIVKQRKNDEKKRNSGSAAQRWLRLARLAMLPMIGVVIGGGIIAAIIDAVIGAVILLLIIGFFKKAA